MRQVGQSRASADAGQIIGGTGWELMHGRQQTPGLAVWEAGEEPWCRLQPSSASSYSAA